MASILTTIKAVGAVHCALLREVGWVTHDPTSFLLPLLENLPFHILGTPLVSKAS